MDIRNLSPNTPTSVQVAREGLQQPERTQPERTQPERAQPGDAPTGQVVTAPNLAEDSKSRDESAREVSPKVLKDALEGANKAMDALGTDLSFSVHEKTGLMVVKVVREKDGTVLREFPSKEFLDMLGKLKDMVGAFVDKKA